MDQWRWHGATSLKITKVGSQVQLLLNEPIYPCVSYKGCEAREVDSLYAFEGQGFGEAVGLAR